MCPHCDVVCLSDSSRRRCRYHWELQWELDSHSEWNFLRQKRTGKNNDKQRKQTTYRQRKIRFRDRIATIILLWCPFACHPFPLAFILVSVFFVWASPRGVAVAADHSGSDVTLTVDQTNDAEPSRTEGVNDEYNEQRRDAPCTTRNDSSDSDSPTDCRTKRHRETPWMAPSAVARMHPIDTHPTTPD